MVSLPRMEPSPITATRRDDRRSEWCGIELFNEPCSTLKTSTEQEKSELGKLAGKMAKVTGDVTGDTILVKTVAMGTAPKK